MILKHTGRWKNIQLYKWIVWNWKMTIEGNECQKYSLSCVLSKNRQYILIMCWSKISLIQLFKRYGTINLFLCFSGSNSGHSRILRSQILGPLRLEKNFSRFFRSSVVRNGRFQKNLAKFFFSSRKVTFGHFFEKIFGPRSWVDNSTSTLKFWALRSKGVKGSFRARITLYMMLTMR